MTAAMVLALHAASVRAETPAELAAKFGARESVHGVAISPSGQKLLVVRAQPAGGEVAMVVNLADGGSTTPVLSANTPGYRIYDCQFVLETRAVCSIALQVGRDRQIEGATRVMSLATDGKDMRALTAHDGPNAVYDGRYGGAVIDYVVAGDPKSVLMTRDYAEQNSNSIAKRNNSGLGVDAVDVITGQHRQVVSPRPAAVDYMSDGQGNVRLLTTQQADLDGYARTSVNYLYRNAAGQWLGLSSEKYLAGGWAGFRPLAVDPARNLAYGLDVVDGRTVLQSRLLDGSGTTQTVLSRPDVDIDGLVRIGRSRRVVGATYATEVRKVDYFDPELARLSSALGKALGGKQIGIIDATADEGKLVIFATSDTDPGKYYLFDKATKQLGELMPARPELSGLAMGAMKAVSFPAADGTMIPAYLTLPPGSSGKGLPAIVMPHGGPAARDEWGFDWLVQFFANAGYAVLQPNYRGSSGFGTQWFLNNGYQSWATAIGDVNDAGRWLLKQGIAAPGKLGIFGWSYGGYAALQSAVVDPDLYKGIVAVAPVTDLERLKDDVRDRTDYNLRNTQIGDGAYVAQGSPAQHADRFKVPVLLVHGTADANVAVSQSRLMKAKLEAAGKSVRYIEFDGLTHQLDQAAARTTMLTESDSLFRKAFGM